jgi:putative Holliday junction resolvase
LQARSPLPSRERRVKRVTLVHPTLYLARDVREKMRSLGLDIGGRRTGVAISDPQGMLAFPLTVLANKDEDATIDDIIRFVEQYGVGRIVVGLPRCLNGELGEQASKVTAFTEKLSQRLTHDPPPCEGEGKGEGVSNSDSSVLRHSHKVDIQLWDERLSTVAAERLMIEAGTKRNKRRQQRDAMAAAFILQGFLDSLKGESF